MTAAKFRWKTDTAVQGSSRPAIRTMTSTIEVAYSVAWATDVWITYWTISTAVVAEAIAWSISQALAMSGAKCVWVTHGTSTVWLKPLTLPSSVTRTGVTTFIICAVGVLNAHVQTERTLVNIGAVLPITCPSWVTRTFVRSKSVVTWGMVPAKNGALSALIYIRTSETIAIVACEASAVVATNIVIARRPRVTFIESIFGTFVHIFTHNSVFMKAIQTITNVTTYYISAEWVFGAVYKRAFIDIRTVGWAVPGKPRFAFTIKGPFFI